MILVLVKLCFAVAAILWKCHYVIATRTITGANINVCENVADHIFIQDIEDCTKYIVCVSGKGEKQQCKSGLYFDATRQACIPSRQSCLQCPTGRLSNSPLIKTCDKYISCYYGQSLLKKCEKNQQFNVKTGKCDLAKNVDCVENQCSIYTADKESMYLPSFVNCSNYYICLAGQTKMHSCPEGLYFSTECNCCDKAENVQCLVEDLKTSKENSKQKVNRLNSNFSKLEHTSTIVGETNKVKCPLVGYFLYQYIEDSDNYYTCVDGKATLYKCPSGFHFNDKIKRCISKVKSAHSTAYEENKCPEFGTYRKPHTDNNKYISCNNGQAMILDCPEEHYFDVSDNFCHPHVEGLGKKELSRYGTAIYELGGIMCPKFDTFIYPHVEKNRYYICVNGIAMGFACAQGHTFDKLTNTCKRDSTQTKSHENQTPFVLNEPVNILCPSQGTMKIVHKEKHKFYLCVNGMGSVLSCAKGSFFEAEMGICRRTFDLKKAENESSLDTMDSTEIIDETSVRCPISGTFIYPHTEKNLYYVCLEGKSIVLTCPEGQNFDTNKKVCRDDIGEEILAAQVPVVLDEISSIMCPTAGAHKFPHIEKRKFYLCLNGMGSVFACPEGNIFKRETGTCHKETVRDNEIDSVEASQMNCPKFGTFLYPHTAKDKYFVCLDGSLFDLHCAEGLIFDSKRKACHKNLNEIFFNTT